MAKNLNISILLDFYGDMLTEKQREVVELYYNEDLSLSEIAINSGITRQGVRDSIKRAEVQLNDYEEKLLLAKRFKKIQDGLDTITTLARDIDIYNQKISMSKDIEVRINKIIEISEFLND